MKLDKSAPSKWALERALKFNGHIECKCAVREGKSPCVFCRDMALEFDAIAQERDKACAEKCKCDLSVGFLCEKHARIRRIVGWLDDRKSNCLKIAKQKNGADRKGWMEDSEYYEEAMQLLCELTEKEGKRG